MKSQLFVTASRFPELAGFSASQQQQFLKLATQTIRIEKPLLAETPVILCSVGAFIGWVGLPAILVCCFDVRFEVKDVPLQLHWLVLGLLAGGACGGFAGKQILYHQMRRYLVSLFT
jgi:hypothetical protein